MRLLSALFVSEHNCILCDRELPVPSRYLLCHRCYGTFEVIGDRYCLKCGKMLFGEEDYCLDCQNFEKHFDRAFSPVAYSAAAAMLVQDLKFHGRRYLAEPLARWMIDRFLGEEIVVDAVIPVPLHPNRKKERGYNQSELLADVIAERLRLPMITTAVCREKDTLASTGLEGGRTAREENMKGAFKVLDGEAIKEKVLLVVDDVITTGTTTSFLSEELKKAGAKKVYVLTYASAKEKPPLQEDY